MTEAEWLESCTCPAAIEPRQRLIEENAASERDEAARRDAVQAVFSRTTAETDIEAVRADLPAEFARRGVTVDDVQVDWTSQWIVASVRNDKRAVRRLLLQQAGLLGHIVRDAIRVLRQDRG